jgi:hypothetical protein
VFFEAKQVVEPGGATVAAYSTLRWQPRLIARLKVVAILSEGTCAADAGGFDAAQLCRPGQSTLSLAWAHPHAAGPALEDSLRPPQCGDRGTRRLARAQAADVAAAQFPRYFDASSHR